MFNSSIPYMLLISLLLLLLSSNAVILKRDKSIVYNKVAFFILILTFYTMYYALNIFYMHEDINLYEVFFHICSIITSFNYYTLCLMFFLFLFVFIKIIYDGLIIPTNSNKTRIHYGFTNNSCRFTNISCRFTNISCWFTNVSCSSNCNNILLSNIKFSTIAFAICYIGGDIYVVYDPEYIANFITSWINNIDISKSLGLNGIDLIHSIPCSEYIPKNIPKFLDYKESYKSVKLPYLSNTYNNYNHLLVISQKLSLSLPLISVGITYYTANIIIPYVGETLYIILNSLNKFTSAVSSSIYSSILYNIILDVWNTIYSYWSNSDWSWSTSPSSWNTLPSSWNSLHSFWNRLNTLLARNFANITVFMESNQFNNQDNENNRQINNQVNDRSSNESLNNNNSYTNPEARILYDRWEYLGRILANTMTRSTTINPQFYFDLELLLWMQTFIGRYETSEHLRDCFRRSIETFNTNINIDSSSIRNGLRSINLYNTNYINSPNVDPDHVYSVITTIYFNWEYLDTINSLLPEFANELGLDYIEFTRLRNSYVHQLRLLIIEYRRWLINRCDRLEGRPRRDR